MHCRVGLVHQRILTLHNPQTPRSVACVTWVPVSMLLALMDLWLGLCCSAHPFGWLSCTVPSPYI